MKILLAEDDINISMIAKLVLEQIGGHQVEVANDGQIALDKALASEFDLILLDEMMPRMNGLKVCAEIQDKKGPSTPIIFLSAKSQSADIESFEESGRGFIPKPFDPNTLCNQIDDLLNKSA